MAERREVIKYFLTIAILIVLISMAFVLRGRFTGHAIYFPGPGPDQTTLMLQVADLDNLRDSYVKGDIANTNYGSETDLHVKWGTPKRIAYLTFNISGIPSNQIIDNSSLCLYIYNDQGTQTIGGYHVYESWNEYEITWNNQPCGSSFDNSTACNLTAASSVVTDDELDNSWLCWNVIDIINVQYGSDELSIVLYTPDTGNADMFYSKEYSDASLRPYLNITYRTSNTPPVLNLVSPQEGASYGFNESLELNFSVSDSDENLNSCWYNLDNGENISISNCANTTFDVAGDGDYVLNIFANDSEGEEVSDSANFSVQVGAPSIVLYFPIGVYLNFNNIEFNYTPSDLDLDSCELWGDFGGEFGLNQTDTGVVSGQVNNFNLNLEEGNYSWNIRCEDSVGNSAFNGNKSFYVDTTAPGLSISEPSGAKTSRTVSLIFNVEDNSPVHCWYNVYRGENIEISNTSVNCDLDSSFSVSVDADFVLNFYVNDSAGNLNYSSSGFSVDTSVVVSPPSGGGGGGGGSVKEIEVLEISEIGDIIAREGDKKVLSLNVKNIGKKFINNCRLVASGDISSWIYSTQVGGIAPGETIDFVFDLNVPENVEEEGYSGVLELICDELVESRNIFVSILHSLRAIEIKEITYEKEDLEISYVFDSSAITGESVEIVIWIVDEEGNEVKRYVDSFSLDKVGLISREVLIDLPEDLVGVYDVYFAVSPYLENFVRQSVVLGSAFATGQAVLGGERGRIIGYSIFVVLIAIGLLFLLKRKYHKRSSKKSLKSKDSDSNHWLLRTSKK